MNKLPESRDLCRQSVQSGSLSMGMAEQNNPVLKQYTQYVEQIDIIVQVCHWNRPWKLMKNCNLNKEQAKEKVALYWE